MIPAAGLMTALMRSRLAARHAHATIGIGERRSRAKGSGMEFMDHREYQPGDDVRHLDPHLYARTGGYFVRQYAVTRKLLIAMVVAGSASMNCGTPTKFDFARGLAWALAFAGLAGGDVIEVGVYAANRLSWSPRLRGMRRAPVIFDWLAAQSPGGSGFVRALAGGLRRRAHQRAPIPLPHLWCQSSATALH